MGGLSCVGATELEESLSVVDSKSSDPDIDSNLSLNLTGGMVSWRGLCHPLHLRSVEAAVSRPAGTTVSQKVL